MTKMKSHFEKKIKLQKRVKMFDNKKTILFSYQRVNFIFEKNFE